MPETELERMQLQLTDDEKLQVEKLLYAYLTGKKFSKEFAVNWRVLFVFMEMLRWLRK